MKYHFLALLIALPSLFVGVAQATGGKEKNATVQGVTRLPFGEVAPLPGAIAISSNGHIAAHIGSNGEVVLWDTVSMQQLETIQTEGKKPSAVALSSNGNLIAIGYFDSRLIVRSRQEKKLLRVFHGHSGGISALAFSIDGQMLASGANDATTQLWDMVTGRRLRIFDSMFNGDISDGSGIPVSIGFSGDRKVLIINEWYDRHYDVARNTTLWDIETGIEIVTRYVTPPNHDHTMRAGHALGGKGWLLTYTGEPVLMVERLDKCESARQLPSGGYADTVAADPQGRWVAVADDNDKLTFFGLSGEKKASSITLPTKAIALAVHPDGRSVFALMISDTQPNGNERFIFGRNAATVTGGALYRIPVPTPIWHLPPLNVKGTATHCAPTGALRLQQDFKLPEKPVELAVIAKFVPTKEMTTDPSNPTGEYNQINPPRELYFDQKGKLYALYHSESDFRSGVAVWDLQTRQLLRSRFKRHVPNNLIRLREGWGAAEETLIDLLTGKRLSTVSNDDDKNKYVGVTSDRDTGQIFRLTAKHFERYDIDGRGLPNIKTNGNVVDYSVRNGRLAALYENGNVQVWQLEPNGKSKTYKLGWKLGDGEWAEELALSSDGRYLRTAFPNASGDGPTQYVIYRLNSAKSVGDGALLAPFPARSNRAVVPDSRPHRLAIWDYDKGKIIARLPRHRSRNKEGAYAPLKAAISDDGRLIASASYDGLVRIWDIGARKMIGEGRVHGPITAMTFDTVGRQLAVGREDGQLFVLPVDATK